MKVRIDRALERDLKNLQNQEIIRKVFELVDSVVKAKSLNEISGIKKLKGSNQYYRIRLGNYRLGLSYDGEEVILYRFLHRKDIYRYFP